MESFSIAPPGGGSQSRNPNDPLLGHCDTGAVAAGVRRVEAVCGKMAEIFVDEKLELINSIQESLKHPKELQKTVENLINENAELKKKLEKLETRQLAEIKNELLKKAESVNGTIFIGRVVEVNNPDALKKLCFELKNETPGSTIVLAANIDSKAYVAILLDEKLVVEKNLDASRIIKEEIAPLIKGGGGGHKALATAGGQDTSKLEQVIQKVKSLL